MSQYSITPETNDLNDSSLQNVEELASLLGPDGEISIEFLQAIGFTSEEAESAVSIPNERVLIDKIKNSGILADILADSEVVEFINQLVSDQRRMNQLREEFNDEQVPGKINVIQVRTTPNGPVIPTVSLILHDQTWFRLGIQGQLDKTNVLNLLEDRKKNYDLEIEYLNNEISKRRKSLSLVIFKLLPLLTVIPALGGFLIESMKELESLVSQMNSCKKNLTVLDMVRIDIENSDPNTFVDKNDITQNIVNKANFNKAERLRILKPYDDNEIDFFELTTFFQTGDVGQIRNIASTIKAFYVMRNSQGIESAQKNDKAPVDNEDPFFAEPDVGYKVPTEIRSKQ